MIHVMLLIFVARSFAKVGDINRRWVTYIEVAHCFSTTRINDMGQAHVFFILCEYVFKHCFPGLWRFSMSHCLVWSEVCSTLRCSPWLSSPSPSPPSQQSLSPDPKVLTKCLSLKNPKIKFLDWGWHNNHKTSIDSGSCSIDSGSHQ